MLSTFVLQSQTRVHRVALHHTLLTIPVCIMLAVPHAATAQGEGHLSLSFRRFSRLTSPALPTNEADLVGRFRLRRDWDNRHQSFTVEPFVRLDLLADGRSEIDLRDLYWLGAWGSWEITAGIRQLFWGVTESRHLVDQINQRSPVASPQGYEKLGQPVVSVAFLADWGNLELLFLPVHRTPRFVGRSSHLWSDLRVVHERSVYEASNKLRPGAYGRWSHTLNDLDLGLTLFHGTARDARFESVGDSVWIPHYDIVERAALDLQWTVRQWLVKIEAMVQRAEADRYNAVVGGVEFAPADFAALMVEYSYDSRGSRATMSFENDLFVGGQLIAQDGLLRAGVFVDSRTGTVIATATLAYRLGATTSLGVEARGFRGERSSQPGQAWRLDPYLSAGVTRFF